MFQITMKDAYWERKYGSPMDIIRIYQYASFCHALTDFEQFVNLPGVSLEFIWLDEF